MGRSKDSSDRVRTTIHDSLPRWVNEFRDWTRLDPMPVEAVMEHLIALAAENVRRRDHDGGRPYAAAIVQNVGAQCRIVAVAPDLTHALGDSTAHAGLSAIRLAEEALGKPTLEGSDETHYQLILTVQPCDLCSHAAVLARVHSVVYAAPRPSKRGERLDESLSIEVDLPMTSLRELRSEAQHVVQEWIRGSESRGSDD